MTEPHDWRLIYERSRPNRRRLKRYIMAYGMLNYLLLVWSLHMGAGWLGGLGEILASQLPVLGVRWLWEHGHLLKALNPKIQSWAFLADWVGLMPMLVCAAQAWPELPRNALFNGWLEPLWPVLCAAVGVAGALSFRRGEAGAYDVLRYYSYSKLLHNGVAFSVLFSIMLYADIPVWFTGAWSGAAHYPAWVLGFFLVWVAGVVGDAIRGTLPDGHPLKLEGRNLHPQADERGRALEPELADVPTLAELRREQPHRFGWADLLHGRRWLQLLRRK